MMLGLEQHEFDVFLFVCRDGEYREFLKSFAAAVPKCARICRPEDPDHRLRPASAAGMVRDNPEINIRVTDMTALRRAFNMSGDPNELAHPVVN